MFESSKKYITLFVIFIVSSGFSLFLGNFNLYIPDEAEYISGASNFTKNNTLIEPSLNKEFDTVFFYSLNGSGIKNQYATYSARFPGSIIFYSILNFIAGEIHIKKTYQITLAILGITLCTIIGLMIGKEDKKNLILAYLGGMTLYIIYSEIIFDIFIANTLLLTGLYFIFWRKNWIGHTLIIMCCWYRYEYIVLYGIIWLYGAIGYLFQKKTPKDGKILKITTLGLIVSIFLIYGLQTFYKKELGLSRDNLDYVVNEYFGIHQDAVSISDNDSSAIKTAIRYSGFRIDQLGYRLWHLYYLFIRTSFISLLIPIGGMVLIFNLKGTKKTELRKILLIMILFNLVIYGRDIRYFGYDRDILHGSYIRYSLQILIILGAIGARYIFKQHKIIVIIMTFVAIFPTIEYLKYQYYISINGDFYATSGREFANKIKEKTPNIKFIWIASNDLRKILYLDYPNQFSLDPIPNEFVLQELKKLQSKSLETGYKVIFATNKYSISPKIVPFLDYLFYPPEEKGKFKFYLMRSLDDVESRELYEKLDLKVQKAEDEY